MEEASNKLISLACALDAINCHEKDIWCATCPCGSPDASGLAAHTLELSQKPGREYYAHMRSVIANKVSSMQAASTEQGSKPEGVQSAPHHNTNGSKHSPAMLTPMEALTPLSCAELARTLVLWPRNLTSDFASSLAPLSLPCLHISSW